MTLATDARRFWSAAYFYRHAEANKRYQAISVLSAVAKQGTGRAQTRAAELLREIKNGTAATTEPPRAG